jgi:hypothetical protein
MIHPFSGVKETNIATRGSGPDSMVIVMTLPTQLQYQNKFLIVDTIFRNTYGFIGAIHTATQTGNCFFTRSSGKEPKILRYKCRHLKNIVITLEIIRCQQKKDVVFRDWNDAILTFKAFMTMKQMVLGKYKG